MAADHDKIIARKGRTAGLLIAGTILVWGGLQWVATQTGWSQRTMVLFDLIAMAAMIYALFLTYQIWRSRQNSDANKG